MSSYEAETRRLLWIVAIVGIILIAGWLRLMDRPPDPFELVGEGLSFGEISVLLGKPDAAKRYEDGGSIWFYHDRPGGGRFHVEFDANDQVTSWGEIE